MTPLVRPIVRFLSIITGALFPLVFVTSCSPSRVADSDRVFEAGVHKMGSIIKSDVFLERGATLEAAYLADSRVFISQGASLTGLKRGVRESSIYYESGALFPNHRRLSIRRVDNINDTYRDRYLNYLPTGPSNQGRGVAGSAVFVGGGFGAFGPGFGPGFVNRGFWGPRRGNFSGVSPARSVSVRPSSYRSRN